MAHFKVPREAIPAFSTLLSLNDSDFERFRVAAMEGSRLVTLDEIISRVTQLGISTFGPGSIELLLKNLASLRMVVENTGKTEKHIVSQVIEALKNYPAIADVNPEQWQTILASRLRALLKPSGSLTVVTRAESLVKENLRSFHGAKIITDIRPIFGPSSGEEPLAFTTVHSLKLVYLEEHHLKDFFVVLNKQDLLTIQRVVARALEKESSIATAIGNAGLTILELTEDEDDN